MLLLVIVSTNSATSNAETTGRHKAHKTMKYKPLKVLPRGHRRITYNGKPYYFNSGKWYRKTNGLFVAITAPTGVIISTLPNGYLTHGIGINRYFHFADVYYKPVPTGYMVISTPQEAMSQVNIPQDTKSQGTNPQGTKENQETKLNKLIIYPAEGQSKKEQARDKYECYEWSRTESGFDPAVMQSTPQLQSNYLNAMNACLEARKYIVK